MEKFKDAFKHSWIFFVYAAVGLIYEVVNRPWGEVRNISIGLDANIPFIKEFIIPYMSWHLFVVGCGIYLLFKDRRNYYKSMYSVIIGLMVCYGTYIIFQTTVPRPIVMGDDILSQAIRTMYSHDKPLNCFPSIHVYTTVLFTYFILITSRLKKYQIVILIAWSTAIVLSTLFVKQHVVLDVIGGCALVYACVGLVNWFEARNDVKINNTVENEGQV